MACGCRLAALLTALLVLLAATPPIAGALLFVLVVGLPRLLGHSLSVKTLVFLAALRAPEEAQPKSRAARLCDAAGRFQEHVKAFQVRTLEARRVFEEACLRVLPSISEEARWELDNRLRNKTLQEVVPAPRAVPKKPPMQAWQQCGSAWERRFAGEVSGGAWTVHRRLSVLPLRERKVAARDVRAAFERAEIVRFDGRELLPAELFNTTLADLARLHPEAVLHASTDGRHGFENMQCWPALMFFTELLAKAGPGSLLEWLLERGLTAGLLSLVCSKHWRLGELDTAAFERAGLFLGMNAEESYRLFAGYQALAVQHRGLLGSNINVNRLPRWTGGAAGFAELAQKLGLAGEVEYAHNLIWTGAARGGIHLDIQDNVLVQLNGESEVFLVPANCSLGIELGFGGAAVTTDWIRAQGKDFPFFIVKLRPGDALAIPSNTMHIVSNPDPARLAMNFFLEPKMGKMRWRHAPANFYNNVAWGHLAMRELWLKTVKEVWRTRDLRAESFVVHGQRQELL